MNIKIGFCSGCFDGGLHLGHLYLLRTIKWKFKVDYLYISINCDDYIVRKKGRKPLRTAEERKNDLLSTGLVDYVDVREEDSPLNTILELKPHLIFVGSDYQPEEVVGYYECSKWGGKIIVIKRLGDYSTTKIYQEIQSDLKTL